VIQAVESPERETREGRTREVRVLQPLTRLLTVSREDEE
jgi:hypothetical protein